MARHKLPRVGDVMVTRWHVPGSPPLETGRRVVIMQIIKWTRKGQKITRYEVRSADNRPGIWWVDSDRLERE